MRLGAAAVVRLLLVVLSTLVLASCVAPAVQFDKSAAASIRRIALLRVAPPARITVINNGGAASAFGLVGAGIQASVNDSNSTKFQVALTPRAQVGHDQVLVEALLAELRKDGYEVTYLADQGVKLMPDGKSFDYSAIRTDADALLHVSFNSLGYVSDAGQTDYFPRAQISARLLDARTFKEFYSKRIMAGKFEYNVSTAVPIDESAKFESFDALMANVDRAAAGLLHAERAIASRIAKDLAKQP